MVVADKLVDFIYRMRYIVRRIQNTKYSIQNTNIMKKEIHPEYNAKSKATCACGAKFEVGSTQPEIEVEICSACHPFYTGQEKVLDTAGRVDKFKKRMAAAKPVTKKKKTVKKKEEEAKEA